MEMIDIDTEELTNLAEKGAAKDGVRQTLDRRIFVQLLVFRGCRDHTVLVEALR